MILTTIVGSYALIIKNQLLTLEGRAERGKAVGHPPARPAFPGAGADFHSARKSLTLTIPSRSAGPELRETRRLAAAHHGAPGGEVWDHAGGFGEAMGVEKAAAGPSSTGLFVSSHTVNSRAMDREESIQVRKRFVAIGPPQARSSRRARLAKALRHIGWPRTQADAHADHARAVRRRRKRRRGGGRARQLVGVTACRSLLRRE